MDAINLKIEQAQSATNSYLTWADETLPTLLTYDSAAISTCKRILTAVTTDLIDTSSPAGFWLAQANDAIITIVKYGQEGFEIPLMSMLMEIASLPPERLFQDTDDNRYALIIEQRFNQFQKMLIDTLGEI